VSSRLVVTGQKRTRSLEDRTRMTVKGYRYRVGNDNHPFNELYRNKGFEAVYEAMGLINSKSKAHSIRKTVLALYDRTKEGYVYLIGNPAWDGWLKCGMAVDADDRCKSYNTGSPYRDYLVHFKAFTQNRHAAEKLAHTALKTVSNKSNGEWFKVDPKTAAHLLKSVL